ncbi:MAG: maltokinase N-terminal cap-like domain-containing protein [Thermomicrobiales bacterium]
MTAGRSPEPHHTLSLDADLGPESIDDILRQVATGVLPTFLPSRRWFGNKQRRIVAAQVTDRALIQEGADYFALCVVRVEFEAGPSADYFVPLGFTGQTAEPQATLATLLVGNGPLLVVDAPALVAFRRWLAGEFLRQTVRDGQFGRFAWSGTNSIGASINETNREVSRVVSVEQSNTSIIYGREAILKVFRRVEPGPNPDAELGQFLTARTDFRHIPPFLGELRYTDLSGKVSSLAVAQGYVANKGDGWSHILSSVSNAPWSDGGVSPVLVEDARLLGLRTAQMHVALASDASDSSVRPELITERDIATWSDAIETSIIRVDRVLDSASGSFIGSNAESISAFTRAMGGFRLRLSGLDLLLGRSKIRVHGDFHLGQTLRTTGHDFVVLDFEGEPQRTIAERRAKTTPLKDVAGMLRSFGYARGAVEREGARADAQAWERAARDAFLTAYFDEVRAKNRLLVPKTRDEFREALVPWELDKALYEIEYELNNRPDWLWLSLSATLKMA